MGSDLDPAEVTHELGAVPSESHRRGESRPRRNGAGFFAPYPKGIWSIDSEHDVTSEVLGDHIEWLLDRIEPSSDAFLRLVNRPGIEADVFAMWGWDATHGGPRIEPSVLARLGALRIALDVDVYLDDDDDDEDGEVTDTPWSPRLEAERPHLRGDASCPDCTDDA
ncbi:MAG: DUF4279 domain-containing protein [Chloroflexota bacterium]